MNEIVGETLGWPRFLSMLLGLFGTVALVLMAAGVYGLIAFTVSLRLPELGIRAALGANSRQIVQLIVRDGLVLALAGITIGAAGAFLLSRIVRGEVFGVEPSFVSTFAGVAITIAVIVWIASWFPARRAAQVDPTIVLK
jgi:ABC-type antimicrobial peptide transport system permease subunit